MVDEDGNEDFLRLLPPVASPELADLQAALPCPIPEGIRELLELSRGFDNGPLESLEWTGLPGGFGMEETFPHALALAHDGFGNYWVADLQPGSTDWAPIYYASHDPPVIAFQSNSLEHFLREVLRLANPPHESELDTVHERVVSEIWRYNPGAVSARVARSSADPAVRAFALSLADADLIVDLRNARLGQGFSWGRYGPRTKVIRFGELPIFACEAKSRLQRLFRR